MFPCQAIGKFESECDRAIFQSQDLIQLKSLYVKYGAKLFSDAKKILGTKKHYACLKKNHDKMLQK